MPKTKTSPSPTSGRDHLNLAEFPISTLQRSQPQQKGSKVDTVSYQSSRYDKAAKRWVPQTVTLATNSRYGLPTPADENVVLALLFLAKQANDFEQPKVYFTPHQLFRIMRWSANSRSYDRLRDVLRRLKALTILYENAWWDSDGREFQREFATGIISNYEINRQVTGRSKRNPPKSWVRWNPEFFDSFSKATLKRLNLEQLFALRLPTSQRMYRYLDKHFYHAPQVSFDLRNFACGHIGLAPSYDTGQLKNKLKPAIAELESVYFVEPTDGKARYRKVKKGVWKIHFEKGAKPDDEPPSILPAGDLAAELRNRGVMAATASELAATFDSERIVLHLAVFDWLVKRNDSRVSRNPAGFLVQSIRKDYQPPADFVRPKSKNAQKHAISQSRSKAPKETNNREERKKLEAYWSGLSREQKAQIEQQAFAQANPKVVKLYEQYKAGELGAFARRQMIYQYLREQLNSRPQNASE